MRSEFEKLLYAFGTQLYHLDTLLYDVFDDRFKHSYVTFCRYDDETKQEWEEIENIKELYSITELLKEIISQCDYHTLARLRWTISDYTEKHKKYKITTAPTVKTDWFSDDIKNREDGLKLLGLDSWRKSNIKELHEHYWFWINHLKDDEDCRYVTWVFRYNDTRMFDMFHLTNYGDKDLMKIIFDYIIDNNIVENQIEQKYTFDMIHPMIKNMEFKSSSDKGGMWYSIYLTAKELQEIYSKMGPRKARRFGCYSFFSYINSFKNDYELDTKFYFYFQGE